VLIFEKNSADYDINWPTEKVDRWKIIGTMLEKLNWLNTTFF
jgi:hypothetical protein